MATFSDNLILGARRGIMKVVWTLCRSCMAGTQGRRGVKLKNCFLRNKGWFCHPNGSMAKREVHCTPKEMQNQLVELKAAR